MGEVRDPSIAEPLIACIADSQTAPALTSDACIQAPSVRVGKKIGIPFTVTNRQPAPCGRGSASGRLRKSPILSRDQRERASALNGPGYDCFTGRSGTGQDALDAANCLADSLWILDQSEADVAFAHGAEADSGGHGDQRLFEQEF